jgi:hypothetical protein
MRIKGESVTLRRADGGEERVNNALVRHLRSDKETTTVSVLWPKGAPHDVSGCVLDIRGRSYRVYGHPFPVHNSPTAHDMRFEATTAFYRHDVCLLRMVATTSDWTGGTVEVAERVEAKARLIEVRDGAESDAGADRLVRTVALEVQPGAWFEGCGWFEYEGERYRVEGANLLEYVTGGGVAIVGEHDEICD